MGCPPYISPATLWTHQLGFLTSTKGFLDSSSLIHARDYFYLTLLDASTMASFMTCKIWALLFLNLPGAPKLNDSDFCVCWFESSKCIQTSKNVWCENCPTKIPMKSFHFNVTVTDLKFATKFWHLLPFEDVKSIMQWIWHLTAKYNFCGVHEIAANEESGAVTVQPAPASLPPLAAIIFTFDQFFFSPTALKMLPLYCMYHTYAILW